MSNLHPRFTINQANVRLSARHPVQWARVVVDSPVLAHDHEFTEICLVLKGTGIHITEASAVDLQENQIFIVPAGSVHAFQKLRDLEVINIYFLPEWFLPEIQFNGEGDGILSLFFPNRSHFVEKHAPSMSLKFLPRLGGKSCAN